MLKYMILMKTDIKMENLKVWLLNLNVDVLPFCLITAVNETSHWYQVQSQMSLQDRLTTYNTLYNNIKLVIKVVHDLGLP